MNNILIALVGAIINILLSVIVPCLVSQKKELTNQPLVNDIKELYRAKRELIFSSSVIIAITIYLALEVTPVLKDTLMPQQYESNFMVVEGFPRNLMRLLQ